MNILTLITDWNNEDYYVGMVKGYLLKTNAEVQLAEISHRIPLFSSLVATFICRASYESFPEGTVHVLGIRGGINKEVAKPVAVSYKNHWFFGFNNPDFQQMFDAPQNPTAWALPDFNTSFPELDLLIKPAIQLLEGVPIEKIATGSISLERFTPVKHETTANSMVGAVLYIDGYGNAITNISRTDFESFTHGRKFRITLLRQQNVITEISSTVGVEEGELFAIFNSLGLLEVGQVNSRLDESIGIDVHSKIRIQLL